MDIAELQTAVDAWIKTHGVRYFNELTNMTILVEEVGELARVMARKYGEQSYKEGEKEYLVKCEMTEETDETVKTCNTREEAEKALEQILNQYDRGQRVIKIK